MTSLTSTAPLSYLISHQTHQPEFSWLCSSVVKQYQHHPSLIFHRHQLPSMGVLRCTHTQSLQNARIGLLIIFCRPAASALDSAATVNLKSHQTSRSPSRHPHPQTQWHFRLTSNSSNSTAKSHHRSLGETCTPTNVTPPPHRSAAARPPLVDNLGSFFVNGADTDGAQQHHGSATRRPTPRPTLRSLVQLLLRPPPAVLAPTARLASRPRSSRRP